jgi:hypothetical protein
MGEAVKRLRRRLGSRELPQLTALGNFDLLALPKTALFCLARCPHDAILRTYDHAAKWRDEGRCTAIVQIDRRLRSKFLRGKNSVAAASR